MENYFKLKPEVKEQWLKALRSGAYVQGKGRLQENGRFCCLGVLCDLYDKETNTDNWRNTSSANVDHFLGGGVPGDQVLGWATTNYLPESLDDDTYIDAAFMISGTDKSLTTLNDDGKSFKEIADIIERKF